MDLSISIVNYNGEIYLSPLLDSIYTRPPSCLFEVFVVDNASSDNSVSLIQRRYPQVKLTINSENTYYAQGTNSNLAMATGRYVLISNNDVMYESDCLDRMVRFMDQHPEIGILGPQVLRMDGSIQESGCRFQTIAFALFEYLFLNYLFPNNPVLRNYSYAGWDRKSLRPVDFVGGACFLIRRSLYEQIGGLDAAHFLFYGEEADYCRRAWQAGWQVVYYPDARVRHHVAGTTRAVEPWAIFRLRHRSLLNYYRKYYGPGVYCFLMPFFAFHTSVVFIRERFRR
jgi:GT2 family glycosyltransferase